MPLFFSEIKQDGDEMQSDDAVHREKGRGVNREELVEGGELVVESYCGKTVDWAMTVHYDSYEDVDKESCEECLLEEVVEIK